MKHIAPFVAMTLAAGTMFVGGVAYVAILIVVYRAAMSVIAGGCR